MSLDHSSPTDCQLLLTMTGSKEEIRKRLLRVVAEIDNSYGKPIQGTIYTGGSVFTAVTPIWKGKEY